MRFAKAPDMRRGLSLCSRIGRAMPMRLETRYVEYDGTAAELSRELFGEDAVSVLGGTPIACRISEAGRVADVTLATFAGVNPARIKARAYIERMCRVLGDPNTRVFAVRGEGLGDLPGMLDGASSAELASREEAFASTLRIQNDNAATIAHYLVCHPRVAEVRYPGLKHDECFDIAAQVLVHGFGNVIDYLVEDAGDYVRFQATSSDPFDQVDRLEATLAS